MNEWAALIVFFLGIMLGYLFGLFAKCQDQKSVNDKTGHANCPFCGAGSDYVFPSTADETNVYICCGKCDATGPVAEGSTTKAWELWRTRA